MILIDFSQIMYRMLLANVNNLKDKKSDPVDPRKCRIVVLNGLHQILVRFKREYGNPVLCLDDTQYWRRTIFPGYKMRRAARRKANQTVDFEQIVRIMTTIQEEMRQYFPYKTIQVTGMEADDIIATLAIEATEPVIIVSRDEDFLQLQTAKHIKQYDPVTKKYLVCDTPERFLFEHIVRGDDGDDIPNIFSSEDTFLVKGKRQKPISQKFMRTFNKALLYANQDPIVHKRFGRNKQLIDLSQIPNEFKQAIIDTYALAKPASRNEFMNYFIANRLSTLFDTLSDF